MNCQQASPVSEYRELPAPAPLADRFLCFWTQTVSGLQGVYILRFQRLLNTAREKGAEQSLTDLAANAGYADQAHMTREVHRLADLRPTALLRSAQSTLQMSDLFKT